ncbi:MAG TPA: dTDP-4-dehydrorhamnose 3,5-epimerase [bacterium]|nr:dTDP-4-dehydrorhamnose 3,5-epimerase [bacterium]
MLFEFKEVSIKGLLLIYPRVFYDKRGYFLESYQESAFRKHGIPTTFVQDNHSYSSKGTLRALHYQIHPYCQGKLIRVVTGAVWDVTVDLRKGSDTYGKWFGLELDSKEKNMLWIPEGFAHGFTALTDDVNLIYKMTKEYNRKCERGIIWNDPDIGIEWPVENPVMSERDLLHPRFLDIPEQERTL